MANTFERGALLLAAACAGAPLALAQPALPRIAGTGPFLLLQPDGQVAIIGDLAYLPHGDGTPLRKGVRTQPKPVPGIGDAVDAAGTSEHAVVALADGRVVGWGERCAATGQRERNVSSPLLEATPVSGAERVVQLAAGKGFTAARTADGSVLVWGERGAGRGGLIASEMADECAAPRRLPLGGVVQISAAQQQLLALARDGTVWAAGGNRDGSLGTGHAAEGLPPTRVPGLAEVVQLAALGDRTVALRRDGSVWQWGLELSERPQRVPFAGRAVAVQGHGRFAMLQAADGSLWAWGEGYGGTFGNGSFDRVSDKPLQVPLNFRPVAWFALNHAGFAWQADGTLVGWGAHGFTPPGAPRRGHSVRPEPLLKWAGQWDGALRSGSAAPAAVAAVAAGPAPARPAGEWHGLTGVAVTHRGPLIAGTQRVTISQEVARYVLWLLPDGTYAEDPAILRDGRPRARYAVADGGRRLVLFSTVAGTPPRSWALDNGVPVTDLGPMTRRR